MRPAPPHPWAAALAHAAAGALAGAALARRGAPQAGACSVFPAALAAAAAWLALGALCCPGLRPPPGWRLLAAAYAPRD